MLMPTYTNIIAEIEVIRQHKRMLLSGKQLIRDKIAAAERDLCAAQNGQFGNVLPNFNQLNATLNNLRQSLIQNSADLATSEYNLNKLMQMLRATVPDPMTMLSDSYPILMFPLRIETRFASNGGALWVRVFPDDISIHQHEENLTAQEILAGRQYWKRLWEHRSKDEAEQAKNLRAAWSQLANLFNANRANWIIRQTKPLSMGPSDTFEGVLKEGDLEPKPLVPKSHAWSQPARCKVLPDFLILELYDDNGLILKIEGNPIPNPLPLSPDPQDNPTSRPDFSKSSWQDTDVWWIQDLDAAVQVGMGFKADLRANNLTNRTFSKILVYGAKAAYLDPLAEGTARMEELLDNHRYGARGLGFLRQGTPTKNTDDKEANYRRPGGYSDDAFELVQQRNSVNVAYKPDSQILAEAIGVGKAIFDQLENSQATDYAEAVAMNHALYPGTLGFLTENMLHPALTINDLKKLREFFTEYVTGRGPLPCIRVGEQPYGLLLTSDFERWDYAPDAMLNPANPVLPISFYGSLHKLINNISVAWKSKATAVTHPYSPSDPTKYFERVLGLYPASVQFWQRLAYSENLAFNVGGITDRYRNEKLLNMLTSDFHKEIEIIPEGIYQLSKLIFDKEAYRLDANFLVDDQPLSETTGLHVPDNSKVNPQKENYLKWLCETYLRNEKLASTPDADYFTDGTGEYVKKAPLLYLYLRYALLQCLFKCAYYELKRIIPHQKLFKEESLSLFSKSTLNSIDFNFIAGKEFYNIDNIDINPFDLLKLGHPLFTSGNLAGFTLNRLTSIIQDINNSSNSNPYSPHAQQTFLHLQAYFDALGKLEKLPTARLERCFVEHLDSLNYRLDAWQTGLFYHKLQSLRQSFGKGIYLGAYGWLENVRPANQTPVDSNSLPEQLRPINGGQVFESLEVGGFIHTPSMAQAKTAALLRNGYLHYHNPANPDIMAVNLSSDRVREALYLFDGLQKGRELGALLGYQFERGLHDLGLDKFIKAYREAFPLAKKNIGGSSGGVSTTVTNGLTLVQAYNNLAVPDQPSYNSGISMSTDEANRINPLLYRLADNLDAMKDLLLTESIHQLGQGNQERAGAVLKSVGTDLAPPPVFESIRTPRTAETMVTHRVCMVFDTAAPAGQTPKARIESGLNRWLGDLIGNLASFTCTIIQTNADKTISIGEVSFSELRLEPIDLVYLVSKSTDTWKFELEQRVVYTYREREKEKLPADTALDIRFKDAPPGKKNLPTLLSLLIRLKELITASRPMHGQDVDLKIYSGIDNPRNYTVATIVSGKKDAGDLRIRLDSEMELLNAINTALKGFNDQTAPKDMRAQLIALSAYHFPEAIPQSAFGETSTEKEILKHQIDLLKPQLENRINQVNAEIKKVDAKENPEELVNGYTLAFRQLFGGDFQVLPRFTFSGDPNIGQVDRTGQIQSAYAAEAQLFNYVRQKTGLSSRRLHLQNWLDSVAKVQPRMENFEWVRTLVAQGGQGSIELHVLQLPYRAGDSWLGLEFPEAAAPKKHKLSVVLHHPGEIFQAAAPSAAVPKSWCGLVIDDWVEEIPGKEEVTGLALNHPQPGSQPPQAMLLAVAPTSTGTWRANTLSGILEDTLRRAKQRVVDPALIADTEWASLLPGLVSEWTAASNPASKEARASVSLNLAHNIYPE